MPTLLIGANLALNSQFLKFAARDFRSGAIPVARA
jgi:hypothetical protein